MIYAITVNGRWCAELTVGVTDGVASAALLLPSVKEMIGERTIIRSILVPRKLLNFVVR